MHNWLSRIRDIMHEKDIKLSQHDLPTAGSSQTSQMLPQSLVSVVGLLLAQIREQGA